MQHEDNELGEGVNDQRRMEFCLSLRECYDQEDLIMECATCSCFYIRCCPHNHERPSYYPCHHYQLVFTDGSCINNGRRDGVVATAGIGAVIGTNVQDQDSRVIDNMVDPGFPRTSQRAELLGALFGLDLLFQRSNYAASVDIKGARKKPTHGYIPRDSASETLVVATDSRYVVEGITEWYSTWKARGWRTANGTTPVNLDLFHRLNARVIEIENLGITVGFWHIPREMNVLADELSKEASRSVSTYPFY